MEGADREFEQRALRNVRTLVDKLARDESNERDRGTLWLLLILIPVAGMFLVMGLNVLLRPSEKPGKDALSCVLDAFNAKSAERERAIRKAEPDLSSRAVIGRLKAETPFLMAEARVQCDPRSR